MNESEGPITTCWIKSVLDVNKSTNGFFGCRACRYSGRNFNGKLLYKNTASVIRYAQDEVATELFVEMLVFLQILSSRILFVLKNKSKKQWSQLSPAFHW